MQSSQFKVQSFALLSSAFVLQALCSYYTMVMMSAALAAALLVRREAWTGGFRVWGPLTAAGAVAVVALVPFLLPYYSVRQDQGLLRTIEDVRVYSATFYDYLATAGRLHYDAWSQGIFTGRTPLFPGLVGAALVIVALASGVGWREPRARMAVAFGTLGVLLSLGANLPGYDWLQTHVTPLQAIRAVARWGLLFLIAVAILAGFAVAALEARWGGRRWWPLLLTAIVTVIHLEAIRAPLQMQRFDGIPEVHRRLAREDIDALVVFPLYGGKEFHQNAPYLLHQTAHWRPMLNAYSSFAPESFYTLAAALQSFPDASAIRTLRQHGFSHVLLHRAPLERDYGAAAVDGLRAHPELRVVFDADGVILYRVN